MVLLFTLAAILLLPGRCFAEVMDKEPSLAAIWTTSLALAILGYGLSRYRFWAGAVGLVVACLIVWAHIEELLDPYVGPAIRQEAGRSYFVQSYIASTLALIVPILGLIQRSFATPANSDAESSPLNRCRSVFWSERLLENPASCH